MKLNCLYFLKKKSTLSRNFYYPQNFCFYNKNLENKKKKKRKVKRKKILVEIDLFATGFKEFRVKTR